MLIVRTVIYNNLKATTSGMYFCEMNGDGRKSRLLLLEDGWKKVEF